MTETSPGEGEQMTTTEALDAVATLAEQTRQREADAAARKAERDAALVRAQRAGATYPQMASAAGLTRDRVAQVLARKRAEQ